MNSPRFSDESDSASTSHRESLIPKSLGRLAAILLVGGVAVAMAYLMRPPQPATGKKLGTLELQGLVGAEGPLSLNDLAGKVVLINFWGTWCGPCMIEFPHLVKLQQRFSDNPDFRFLPVSCAASVSMESESDLRSQTEAYLQGSSFDLPVYFDPEGLTRQAVLRDAELDFFAFPTTILLDRSGTIRYVWPGYRPGVEKEMEAAIKSLLNERR